MATFQKRGNVWRAIIRVQGVSDSASFHTKAEAKNWAAQREAQIRDDKESGYVDKTLADLLQDYSDKESIKKKAPGWEQNRILFLQKDPLARMKIKDIGAPQIAEWRDRRLKETSAGTVLRDWNVISPAFTIAVKEWKWLPKNPMSEVKRPSEPESRDRLITSIEIETMCITLGNNYEMVCGKVERVFRFALESAMRAGEIAALDKKDVHLERRFVRVTGIADGARKTRAAKRDVPLTAEAVRILTEILDESEDESGSVFGVTTSQISAQFRKAKQTAGMSGFTFHDSRHNACTSLSKKLDVLALARAIGHSDIKELMVYYNESAENLAKRLD